MREGGRGGEERKGKDAISDGTGTQMIYKILIKRTHQYGTVNGLYLRVALGGLVGWEEGGE